MEEGMIEGGEKVRRGYVNSRRDPCLSSNFVSRVKIAWLGDIPFRSLLCRIASRSLAVLYWRTMRWCPWNQVPSSP